MENLINIAGLFLCAIISAMVVIVIAGVIYYAFRDEEKQIKEYIEQQQKEESK